VKWERLNREVSKYTTKNLKSRPCMLIKEYTRLYARI
jgi:hypothetical protein